MQKKLLIFLISTATLPGCAWMKQEPPTVPPKNPRVVERELTPLVKKVARVKSTDLALAQSLDDGEQLVKTSAVTPAGPSAQASPPIATQPAKSAAPAVALPSVRKWEVRVSDVRLSATFERWAKEASEPGSNSPSYKVLWDAGKHVLIDATPTYTGTFLDAVEQALSTPAISLSAYPLESCLYPNSPPLLRVTKRGEQTEACPDIK
ncbi:TcpQ domain-containing protein [Janthinobacterium sp. MDT1-19]